MTEAWLVMENAYVANHVTFSAVVAAAWGTAASAEAQDVPNPDKCGGTGTGACRFVPLSKKTHGQASLDSFALLHEIVDFAA